MEARNVALELDPHDGRLTLRLAGRRTCRSGDAKSGVGGVMPSGARAS